MQLPGRLSSSTLGDLLGALHRARVTGLLELSEVRGPRGRTVPGRLHRVHLRDGLVVAVDTPLPVPPGAAPMDALFSLEEATIAFRTARPLPAAQLTLLGPSDFLHGRPRARDRRHGRAAADEEPRSEARPLVDGARDRARGLLGLPRDARQDEVRRAFRRLAGAVHPDRHAAAPAEEQREKASRLAELSAAYHLLVA
jgi:DnaJ domain/Domain of unknown function (DUF4388)